jgi:hypothetical protein
MHETKNTSLPWDRLLFQLNAVLRCIGTIWHVFCEMKLKSMVFINLIEMSKGLTPRVSLSLLINHLFLANYCRIVLSISDIA